MNLGCWGDVGGDRAIQQLDGNHGLTDPYQERVRAYKKCRDVAMNLGRIMFLW